MLVLDFTFDEMLVSSSSLYYEVYDVISQSKTLYS